ncbi:hypothetical protein [Fibrella forsythiae]|uniref:Uncharacterized protein n=1 Tax=Fibrella forsythiae TaxID=2817061 RepID=A0ABS3JEM4_9BACT|nr:hypothetical protein [Fibrella forsythiae]MBO0948453.1 hypothetical protein [Fibrella forsythiae]
MKTKLLLALLLLCPLCLLIGRSITKTTPVKTSLTVNGRPINYQLFTLDHPGVLSVIEGDLKVLDDRAMPYQSLLLQGGSAKQNTDAAFQTAELWPGSWLRGEVANEQALKRKAIPFQVSLWRNGSVVKQWPTDAAETVESIQLKEIWPSAQLGDELIVKPMGRSGAQSGDYAGKQVIKLKKVDPILLKALQEGC